MATAFSPANNVTTTSAANFIPEIWSDEIIAAYKKNLVLANVVKKMSFRGKKGDTVNIPAPVRGSASAKAATDAVTLIADKTGAGTNGILLPAAAARGFAFGEASLARHARLFGTKERPVRLWRDAGLALDIDTPDDLSAWQRRA